MLVTVNGDAALSGSLTLPFDGAWHATFEVDSASPPTGAATVVVGGASFVGTVTRSSTFRERTRVELVGGAGKLATLLPAKAYRNITTRIPLVDALLSAGERLSPYASADVLSRPLARWVRPAGMLRDTLAALVAGTAGAVWRVRADGLLWVGVPDWPEELVDFELFDDDSPARQTLIMTDAFDTLDAGITLAGRKVRTVRHLLDASGVSTEVELDP